MATPWPRSSDDLAGPGDNLGLAHFMTPEQLVGSLEKFGNDLLDTLDLDPVYVALHRARLDRATLKRWLLAYLCFYHGGVASRLASAKDFHLEARKAHDEKWPRGRERRHF